MKNNSQISSILCHNSQVSSTMFLAYFTPNLHHNLQHPKIRKRTSHIIIKKSFKHIFLFLRVLFLMTSAMKSISDKRQWQVLAAGVDFQESKKKEKWKSILNGNFSEISSFLQFLNFFLNFFLKK